MRLRMPSLAKTSTSSVRMKEKRLPKGDQVTAGALSGIEVHLSFGRAVSLQARTGPLGLIGVGFLVSAVLLSTAALVRAARRPPLTGTEGGN